MKQLDDLYKMRDAHAAAISFAVFCSVILGRIPRRYGIRIPQMFRPKSSGGHKAEWFKRRDLARVARGRK